MPTAAAVQGEAPLRAAPPIRGGGGCLARCRAGAPQLASPPPECLACGNRNYLQGKAQVHARMDVQPCPLQSS